MVHSACIDVEAGQKITLLRIARESITSGLRPGQPLTVDTAEYHGALTETLASFVTLSREGKLRGCVGSLRATRPLIQDVAHAAFAAAFQDHRFAPLAQTELATTSIDISVLSTPEPLAVNSEQELLERLNPEVDGLILEDRGHSATFLPKVWEQLPEPGQFLAHLKHKAGLPGDYWSDSLRVHRYRTLSFSEKDFPDLAQA